MCAHQVVKDRIGERWCQEKECYAGGDCGATHAAEGALPERQRTPIPEPLKREARNRGYNFLIERAHDPCPQCRGSTRISQILPQRGAYLIQVLKQRTALGAGSSMALDIRGGERIEFAVEVCLHAQ